MPNISGRPVDAAVRPLPGVSFPCRAVTVECNPPGDVGVVERRQHLHLILEELRCAIGVPMLRLRHPAEPRGQACSHACFAHFNPCSTLSSHVHEGMADIVLESAEPHRLTASLVPPEVMTLYTSADDPLPMTSSLMMSLPRQVSAPQSTHRSLTPLLSEGCRMIAADVLLTVCVSRCQQQHGAQVDRVMTSGTAASALRTLPGWQLRQPGGQHLDEERVVLAPQGLILCRFRRCLRAMHALLDAQVVGEACPGWTAADNWSPLAHGSA